MRCCTRRESRLKRMLSMNFFYKTATIGTTTNVEDIIELPQNKEHVVVVTYVKDSELEIPEKEKVIAHVARVAHDYFLFN